MSDERKGRGPNVKGRTRGRRYGRRHALAIVAAAIALEGSTLRADAPLTIAFTTDLHAHLQGFGPSSEYTPETTGDDGTVGGAARIATILRRIRAERAEVEETVIFLDSGDFTMGTMFSFLTASQALELRVLNAMGCAATTLGNHEFDYSIPGLCGMLSAAADGGFAIPVLSSNIRFSPDDPSDDCLAELAQSGAIRPHLVIDGPAGSKIGVLGLLGINAEAVSIGKGPISFSGTMETLIADASAAVRALREQEGADVVVCLSHSGVSDDPVFSEDEILAQLVDGIDVILSGHSHTPLARPIVVRKPGGRDTIVVQAGAYGESVGDLRLAIGPSGVRLLDYTLVRVDDAVPGNPAIQAIVDAGAAAVDALIAPLAMDMPVAETAFDITCPEYAESNLGNLVADAMRAALNAVEVPATGEPVRAYFEARGVLRDDLLRGDRGILSVADVFDAVPLGMGPDGIPGYPLLSFHITGHEIKQALEIGTTLTILLGADAFVHVSGIRAEVDLCRPPFDRVVAVWMGDELAGYEALDLSPENPTLHKVGANLYIAAFAHDLCELLGETLCIRPKRADGTAIDDIFEAMVDADPATGEVEEMKAWRALLAYLANLPDADGDAIPDMPALYAAPTGRIVERFLRGDGDCSAKVDIADALRALDYLFRRAETPACLLAMDANADGRVNIADPVYILNYAFGLGPAPRAPFPEAGPNPILGGPACRQPRR
ncbi:MAG: 5'-nucleotidase C-terminal domain-containing protein [Planctomycetes bacterium]|nr:5'-nucleotidase C-terminal domain-containing protein [Planctomycetota bacterium]